MSRVIRLEPEAREDALAARRFFEGCQVGLGLKFSRELFQSLDRIGDYPEMYGEVWPAVRAVGIRRFGYVIYYAIRPTEIDIIAILHGSRDPGEWQRRI